MFLALAERGLWKLLLQDLLLVCILMMVTAFISNGVQSKKRVLEIKAIIDDMEGEHVVRRYYR
jgi:hypothetical protein